MPTVLLLLLLLLLPKGCCCCCFNIWPRQATGLYRSTLQLLCWGQRRPSHRLHALHNYLRWLLLLLWLQLDLQQ
jgi:hypothetical protein